MPVRGFREASPRGHPTLSSPSARAAARVHAQMTRPETNSSPAVVSCSACGVVVSKVDSHPASCCRAPVCGVCFEAKRECKDAGDCWARMDANDLAESRPDV